MCLFSVRPAGVAQHLPLLRQRVDVRPERRGVQGSDGPGEGGQSQDRRL